jgi:5-hydroxyisourate hydrolase
VSTHVLDTGEGRPAQGVEVELRRGDEVLGRARTDGNGRIGELAAGLAPGVYTLGFTPTSPFFVKVEVHVQLDDGHYHVPLLVSPYSCATYSGS